MKVTLYLFIFCIFIIGQLACGQTKSQQNESGTIPKSEEARINYPNLKSQAEIVNKAVASEDFNTVVDYTHPKVVEKMGGREKMVTALLSSSAQMKTEGSEILSAEIGEANQIEKIDNQLFAVLPIKITVKSPKGRAVGDSSLVGVSDDNGKNWKFISGVSKEGLKTIFPKAADKLQIPEEKPPVMLGN